MQIGSFLGAYPLPNANTGAVFEAKRLSCHAMGTRRSRACMNHRLREAFAVAMLSASTQARGLLKFDLLLWIVVDVDSFPLLKECEAGVSHGMPCACGAAAPCSGLRVLQGFREICGGHQDLTAANPSQSPFAKGEVPRYVREHN